jgi:hypothetical protein
MRKRRQRGREGNKEEKATRKRRQRGREGNEQEGATREGRQRGSEDNEEVKTMRKSRRLESRTSGHEAMATRGRETRCHHFCLGRFFQSIAAVCSSAIQLMPISS